MPTIREFRRIIRLRSEGLTDDVIAGQLGMSRRTIAKTAQLVLELSEGLDPERDASGTGWKLRTLVAGKSALELETRAWAGRQEKQAKIVVELAGKVVVLLPREMLSRTPEWSGGGVTQGRRGPPVFIFEDDPSWDLFVDQVSDQLKDALDRHVADVTAVRRATVSVMSHLSTRLPEGVRSRRIVRNTEIAVEAVEHSFLSWVAASDASRSSRGYEEEFEIEESGPAIVLANGAWRFDLRQEGKDGKRDACDLIAAIGFSFRAVISSMPVLDFRSAYKSAETSAQKLRKLLLAFEP